MIRQNADSDTNSSEVKAISKRGKFGAFLHSQNYTNLYFLLGAVVLIALVVFSVVGILLGGIWTFLIWAFLPAFLGAVIPLALIVRYIRATKIYKVHKILKTLRSDVAKIILESGNTDPDVTKKNIARLLLSAGDEIDTVVGEIKKIGMNETYLYKEIEKEFRPLLDAISEAKTDIDQKMKDILNLESTRVTKSEPTEDTDKDV